VGRHGELTIKDYSKIARALHRRHCRWQDRNAIEGNLRNLVFSRSYYRGYLHVLKYFIIIIIIDNRILHFVDCIRIGIFHWENVLNFHGRKNGGHFEWLWRDAINTFINTFIFGEILPACAKEYLTAATYTYYCQVEVKVRDRTAGDGPPVSCSDIISKQYGGRRVGLQTSNCDSFAKMSCS